MRWVVFALLAINLCFAIWGGLKYGHTTNVGAMNADVSVGLRPMPGAKLITLNEYRASSDNPIAESSMAITGVQPADSQSPGQGNVSADKVTGAAGVNVDGASCVLLGPFQDHEPALDLINRLAAMQIIGKYGSVEMTGGQDYWVYLKPEASRDLATQKLRELQEKKIDSFIIPQGELANGISLGIFDKEENANTKKNEMVDRGYEALIQINQRKYQENWVVLYPDEALKFSNELYSVLHNENNKLDYRKESCDKVASLGDIQ